MYKALVCKVHGIRPIPDADRIRLATVGAYQVIIGLDVEEGTLGLFLEQGGQLSEGFAQANDLIRRKDEAGNPAGGYFEPSRRVKAIKMRGCRSEGFWCPLTLLSYTGYDVSQLREGDQFDALGDQPICNKYITPATRRRMASGSRTQRREVPMFAKHIDTGSFKREAGMIPAGAIIYLSEKCHGTSFRYGHVLDEVEIQRTPVARFFAKASSMLRGQKLETHTQEWAHINGTRNTICEKFKGQDYYGNDDFRQVATRDIRLKKGEVIYGELVGYTKGGAPIMSPQSTAGLKDKKIAKQFGDEMVYRYGCIPGQCRLLVYRITSVNEDGHAVELSWNQCIARCRELGLETVPTFETFIYDGNVRDLQEKIALLTDGAGEGETIPSRLDPSHIQEGIVIRHESEFGVGWLKSKGYDFGRLEGYLKEQDDFVDAEEVA
jgi:hypothetical protein